MRERRFSVGPEQSQVEGCEDVENAGGEMRPKSFRVRESGF